MVLSFEDNIEFYITEMGEYGGDFKYDRAPDEIKNHPLVAKALVEKAGQYFKKVPLSLRDNKEVALAAVKQYGWALEHASTRLQDDEEIVWAAVKATGYAIKHASTRLKSSRELVLLAVTEACSALEYVDCQFRSDREVVLAAVNKYGGALKFCSNDLRNDREIALLAVQQGGNSIEHVNDRLRRDRDIVLAAVKSRGEALGYLSGHLPRQQQDPFEHHFGHFGIGGNVNLHQHSAFLDDREVVLTAVESNSDALEYASARLRGDKEIVVEAVRKSGYALKHASKKLQDDRDVVMVAVLSGGACLEYASERLRNDREVVITAIAGYEVRMGHAKGSSNYLDPVCKPLELASDALCDDAETMLTVYENCGGRCFETWRISKRLRDDKEFIRAGAHIAGSGILKISSERLKKDPDILEAALEFNTLLRRKKEREQTMKRLAQKKVTPGAAKQELDKCEDPFKHMKPYATYNDEMLCNDKDLALRAVRYNGNNLRNVSKELRCDPELIEVAVRGSGWALKWVKPSNRNDRQLVLNAVRNHGTALEFASSALRSDPEIVHAAIKQDGGALLHADKKFYNDKELVLRSIKGAADRERIRKIFQSLPQEVKTQREIVQAVMECGEAHCALYGAGEAARDDEELVLRAIAIDPVNCFKLASKRICGKKSFAIRALESNPKNIRLIPRELLMEGSFLQDVPRIARFAIQMKRLGRDFLNPMQMSTTKDWVMALDQAHKLFNPSLSLSGIYSFLSLNPGLCGVYETEE